MSEQINLLRCFVESFKDSDVKHEGTAPTQNTRLSPDPTEIALIPAIRPWLTCKANFSDDALRDATRQTRLDLENHNLFDPLIHQDLVFDPDNLYSFDAICLLLCDAIETDLDHNQANLIGSITTKAKEVALTQIQGNENLRDELQQLLETGHDCIIDLEPLLAQGLILAMAVALDKLLARLEQETSLN